jgi:hypothetical protein
MACQGRSNVPQVVMVRCHYCSRELPQWRVHHLTRAQTICDHCLEWHNHALEFLAGQIPPGCQACNSSWEFLRDSQIGVEIRMYVVPRDGIYQLLCPTCVQPYIAKRADLYRGTEFGKSLKV